MAIPETVTASRSTSGSSVEPAHGSRFKGAWRKAYSSLGFKKGYNFPLWIIFGGAMLGFCLARISYLNIGGDAPSSFKKGAAPGEWFHSHTGHERIGITLHLAGVIPAGLLMVWQFLPIIRLKALLFHRLNGYAVILLVLIGNAGALMIARDSFEGTLATQAGIGLLAIITTSGMMMAWYNIKRLQIDQHRAWMLRTMFYLGVIITLRIILGISIAIVSRIGGYWKTMPCDDIAFVYDQYGVPAQLLSTTYPQCVQDPATTVAVRASLFTGRPEEVGAVLQLSFGMALWLALFMHVVGVEIYLSLTPKEADRLRQISYEKQLERGFKRPGSAGLVVERFGDAKTWEPQLQ